MVISIVNHKGGTGKTTTAINLGSALARQDQSVLIVDFDPQGSLTYSLGIHDDEPTVAEALLGEVQAASVIHHREGMSILPGGTNLADVELSLANAEERFKLLRELIEAFSSYDFILIDCSPALSLLTINALVASSHILIPMQMDVLALRGLDSMLVTVEKVKGLNPELQILGVLPVMTDARRNIHQEIELHIRKNYNIRILKNAIRTSVKTAEAPSFGMSVLSYAPASTTADDYRALADEILRIVSPTTIKS